MSQNVVALTQALVQKRSYSGQEQEAVKVLSAFFRENGFNEVHVDNFGSVTGTLRGKKKGPRILLDGHIDTVPVPDERVWKHKPFAAELKDGKIYGRGTSDMKGALAAMACAAVAFAEKAGGDFAGSISVAGVVQEECFEGVAARSISREVKPDYVIIGEASELNLKIGQRGRAEIKVETEGKSAHSANPEKGINAVYRMCRLIAAIAAIKPPHNAALGDGILELTDILSAPYPGASVVPSQCVATYDRRLLTGESKEEVLAPLQKVIDGLREQDPGFSAKAYYALGEETCYTGNTIRSERFFPAWLFNEKEAYIQAVRAKMQEKGMHPEITQYNFCTNGSHYAGEAGIATLGFGPSRENLAHTVDEYVEVYQLEQAVEGYIAILEALTGL